MHHVPIKQMKHLVTVILIIVNKSKNFVSNPVACFFHLTAYTVNHIGVPV